MLIRLISGATLVVLSAWLHSTAAEDVSFWSSLWVVACAFASVCAFLYYDNAGHEEDEHHDLTHRENELIRVGLELLRHQIECGTLSSVHEEELDEVDEDEIEALARNMELYAEE